ncbi:MAG: carbohydrate kinase family protein, partial [Chloroflexales bacterium]|nr:carbohydrate kinase family protein [Chloroflexales bacterium]
MTQYDVLCYGALCADTLIRLPRFPTPGEGVRALGEAMVPGGNAMNEARCLATWGERVAL